MASGLVVGLLATSGHATLSPEEHRAVLAHGPWPPVATPDPTNRASGNADAVELGRALFFDVRVARDRAGSCASCHVPEQGFTDGLPIAIGVKRLDRNTPPLLDVAGRRWFGWDGAADSLWAQSLRPIVSPLEMASEERAVASLIARDRNYSRLFRAIYGQRVRQLTAREVFVGAGKALAAFQETLRSRPSPFDRFRGALERGDAAAMRQYPASALRGLRIFVGAGRCSTCHAGPRFAGDEFADVGIRSNRLDGTADRGRADGFAIWSASPFKASGRFSDGPAAGVSAAGENGALARPAFRVPSLRNNGLSAPYMHDGSLATLEEVVEHYTRLPVQPSLNGVVIPPPGTLSDAKKSDLVNFLHSLNSDEPIFARPDTDLCDQCAARLQRRRTGVRQPALAGQGTGR